MAVSTAENKIDAYAQFEKWLSEQPYWLQDATYRIYHGQAIDQSQISAYAMMCVAQAKKESVEYKKLPQNASRITAASSRMSVTNLSDIVGVNALATDATLDFSETGVTVIYGLNGAGKSGFMRVFKQLSGSPYEETIQPNVFKKGESERPSCKFHIIVDGEKQEISCTLSSKTKNTPLVDCDVFDTRISNDYITKTNNVSYQPFVFTVLAELSKVADSISQFISLQMSSIPALTLKIPEEFLSRQDIAWIQQLSTKSSFPSMYSVWNEEQQILFEELPKKLDTDKVKGKLQLFRTQLTSLNSILEDLNNFYELIKSDRLATASTTFHETKRKLEAAEKFFTEKADAQDQLSVSSADWKELWVLAQRYYEETLCIEGKPHFGEEGSICPLCHQPITNETVTRFQSVNEYVNGSCSENHNKATETLRKMLRTALARTYSSEQIETQLSSILDSADVEKIKTVYIAIGESRTVDDIDKEYTRITNIDVDEALKVLIAKRDVLKDNCDSCEKALQDEGRALLQTQYDDLKFHKWVYESKPAIEVHIDNLKKIQEFKNAKSLLTTNKITTESNMLADTLITDAYIERFNVEVKRLAPRLHVKLEKAASQKGSTPYKVSIDTDSGIKCKPEDILSEGEQRIVALSAFFADATGRRINTPLIIDDPISSLDLNYELTATQRIVELARERQVIVFTHRISMLTGIEETCQRLGVAHKENYIRSTANGKGVPDLADIYRGDVKKHLSGIQDRVQAMKKMNSDSPEYLDAIGKQCQQFRICVERSVEDVLLQGIVHRFERRIMTNGKVNKLTRITEEDCKYVDSMMTKYSFTEHSQPIDSPPIEIDIDELSGDIAEYITWISGYRKKMQ